MDNNEDSTILFEAKTHAAHTFKILIETLKDYLGKGRGGSFIVNTKGIFLRNANSKQDILCDVSLLAENFQDYTIATNDDICFSINLNTFYNEMLKKIRKKDSIVIQLLKEQQGMYLRVIKDSAENKGNHTISKTMVINSSSLSFVPPTGYGLPINILSKSFQSCREIRPSNKEIEITCWNDKSLRFFITKDGVVDNQVYFDLRDDGREKVETFKAKFVASYIVRVHKLAGLSETIKISLKKGLPLCYKMNVGCLGTIEIYIKTLEQIQSEQDTEYNCDAEDDCNTE